MPTSLRETDIIEIARELALTPDELHTWIRCEIHDFDVVEAAAHLGLSLKELLGLLAKPPLLRHAEN